MTNEELGRELREFCRKVRQPKEPTSEGASDEQ